MEVDASETGVGVILSLCFGKNLKMHPVAFFSNKLLPTERNYDVGNWKLLTVKLALEEWRHWLEGAKFQFTCIRRVEYLEVPAKGGWSTW